MVAGTRSCRSSSIAAWLTNDVTLPLSSSASMASVMLVSKVRATFGTDREPWVMTPTSGPGRADTVVVVVVVDGAIAAWAGAARAALPAGAHAVPDAATASVIASTADLT